MKAQILELSRTTLSTLFALGVFICGMRLKLTTVVTQRQAMSLKMAGVSEPPLLLFSLI